MTTVLVTGGAGFIATHTDIELLNKGYDVISVDNYGNSSPVALERVEQITGKPVKVFAFRKELAQQMEALGMDESYADRYLNVGFSGGEKKKSEILQLLMLKPKLALLDETDSGLDVDAVKTVAQGVRAYHNEENALLIITHNAKILEGLQVDYVHVLDDARIVRTGDGSLVNEIIEEGFTALKEDEAK